MCPVNLVSSGRLCCIVSEANKFFLEASLVDWLLQQDSDLEIVKMVIQFLGIEERKRLIWDQISNRKSKKWLDVVRWSFEGESLSPLQIRDARDFSLPTNIRTLIRYKSYSNPVRIFLHYEELV